MTDEQRGRRPIFLATLWARASWLFFRVTRSTRMTRIWALYHQSGSDRLEKQPTDLRQNTPYFGDRTLASILIFVLTFGCVEMLFGWGAEGHRAIGTLAQELISPETQVRVQQLLNECGDRDLAAASTWADEVRQNARFDRPRPKDAEVFNQQFPDNKSWHFVDLPLGTSSFSEAERFIHGRNDVIHAIERCIAVLEARESVFGELSRTQALRLLVHFVGDIHQPLHCGSGFYRLSDTEPPVLVTNPAEAFGLPNDRSGNDLFYGPRTELHALWDSGFVEEIADTFDFRSLAALLRAGISSPFMAGNAGRLSSLGRNMGIRVSEIGKFGVCRNPIQRSRNDGRTEFSLDLDHIAD